MVVSGGGKGRPPPACSAQYSQNPKQANGVTSKWGQTLIIDLIRLYFCLISDCLNISDLAMFALRLTAEYVRPNNSPISLFVYKPVPLKK